MVVDSEYLEWTPLHAVDHLAVDLAGNVVDAKRQTGIEPMAALVGFNAVIAFDVGADQFDHRTFHGLAIHTFHVAFNGGDLRESQRGQEQDSTCEQQKTSQLGEHRAALSWDVFSASEYYTTKLKTRGTTGYEHCWARGKRLCRAEP